ncbi:MAG TPA: hypothetical protein VFG04_27285 [Planctomycetaceae bacterium]|jgi:hypothetical protein|nr:hypothetical protein [Planctomycetaceae bacterium]
MKLRQDKHLIIFGDDVGIDVCESPSQELFNEMVRCFAREIGNQYPVVCYYIGHDGSHFVPCSDIFDMHGVRDDFAIPRVPFDRLVEPNRGWKPAFLVVPRLTNTSPDSAEDQKDIRRHLHWHGRVLVQHGEKYIGYLKLGGLCNETPDAATLQAAFFRTMFHMSGLAARSHLERWNTSSEMQENVQSTIRAIRSASTLPAALKHAADLLTSHHGARWNRAACYLPIDDSSPNGWCLRCCWAQGGLGESYWPALQASIASSYPELENLIEVASAENRAMDAYTEYAAQGKPVAVYDVMNDANRNPLALLWRNGGDVGQLLVGMREFEHYSVRTNESDADLANDLVQAHETLAARITQEHEWVEEVNQTHGRNRVFAAANGEYFVVPWLSHRGLLAGIWVVDLACWSVPRNQGFERPSLMLTRRVLADLADAFMIRWATQKSPLRY